MALFLLLIDGSNETRFKIVDGLIIGRSEGEVQLPDPMVSTRHAAVKYSKKEGWHILDLGSRNGIISDGRRLRHLQIKHGVKFMIGKASFKIIDIEDTTARPIEATASMVDDELSLIKETEAGWKESLSRLTRGVEQAIKDSPKNLSPFKPMVNLKFVRGLQYPSDWTIGYGPREFGRGTPEFHLFEPECPEKGFSLAPSTNGVVFESFDTEKVLLNGKATKSDIIKAGDEIDVLGTKIVITFIK